MNEFAALAGHHVVACGHGTRYPRGREAMATLVAALDALSPVPVHGASVDVQEPAVDHVIADLSPDRPCVLIPLLLSVGYHTSVDLTKAAERFPGAESGHPVVIAEPLGPSEEIAEIQHRRLLAAGWHPGETVIMGAAGSSVAAGRRAAAEQCRILAGRLGQDVRIAFGAAAQPDVGTAVRRAREEGSAPVTYSSYILAPGNFQDRLTASGADRVTAPLVQTADTASTEELAGLALRRAVEALYDGTVRERQRM